MPSIKFGLVAQRIEQSRPKGKVVGSIPTKVTHNLPTTISKSYFKLIEYKLEAVIDPAPSFVKTIKRLPDG